MMSRSPEFVSHDSMMTWSLYAYPVVREVIILEIEMIVLATDKERANKT